MVVVSTKGLVECGSPATGTNSFVALLGVPTADGTLLMTFAVGAESC